MDILLEQIVYGSFPFWDRGYDVLARSPGCSSESVAEVLSACRRFGEAPAGVTPSSSLFALRLSTGPWAIVGVEPQGVDDRGRPGALAFHALLVEPRDYRKAGSNPFAFLGAIRSDWSAETSINAVFWTIAAQTRDQRPSLGPRASRIVEALSRGRKVAIESSGPIDDLAREVWPALPKSVRRKASLSTWSFGNANRFDLVALPRLAGVELDRSYIDPASIDSEPPLTPIELPRRLLSIANFGRMAHIGFLRVRSASLVSRPRPLEIRPNCVIPREANGPRSRPDECHPTATRWRGALIVAALAGIIAVGVAGRALMNSRALRVASSPTATSSNEPNLLVDPELRAKIVEALETLADRFEVGGSNEPGDLMVRIAAQLHYRGPTLSTAELARLADDPDPDRDRALAWHDRIKTFADDRLLPEDFDRLPINRQVDRLAWSFHLDTTLPPEKVPGALLKALSREGPIRPTPLAARYPALSDYARFLGRLPRLDDL